MSCRSHLSCRAGCGACCIAPSIASALPGMPEGKPAGVPCAQLLPDMRCAVFGRPDRPAFCAGLKPAAEMCGDSREAALRWLTRLEILTAPQATPARPGSRG
ncbi:MULTISPECIES: YkgJ family cysteine cluster protein [Cupriavidus]|uniref:YkgJ family cysteine cluster protein n=1 Tax=Cupriavidus oxalaticus TaxID=96344 RepID=A0A4P7LED3_9BURK|nr:MULTISPECIES: YkgJ family cysteine cluster protein [Cupriavidus]MBF6986703.1 YkgJ family cysteine cluster protein [Cupriavidus sp. IK-TO18]QBY54005.1 YkgJ family cysteine cluster protein [Cupriavidus oxalaticus]